MEAKQAWGGGGLGGPLLPLGWVADGGRLGTIAIARWAGNRKRGCCVLKAKSTEGTQPLNLQTPQLRPKKSSKMRECNPSPYPPPLSWQLVLMGNDRASGKTQASDHELRKLTKKS